MAAPSRTALITGSGRNIGRAMALALADDGCNVVINGATNRNICDGVAEEVKAKGVGSLVVMGDVGAAADCARMAREAIDRFGAVDILVNNAAIRPHAPFLEISDAEWERVMNVDFSASIWLSRACLPGMIAKGWGRIVNFAGMNALQGTAGRPHVSAAKHAAWGLTKALAREFGAKGITTNIISPGPIRPDADVEGAAAHAAAQIRNVPAGRMGEPAEIAGTVRWLVSDAGAFVNGQVIQVNGGAAG